jgi:hypothetical protein
VSLCINNDERPVHARGLCRPCYKKAHSKGFTGPPPPRAAKPSALADDTYDTNWAAGRNERRIKAVKPLAAALVWSAHRRDASGVRVCLERAARDKSWHELCVVLAECAEPGRAGIVTGIPVLYLGPREVAA